MQSNKNIKDPVGRLSEAGKAFLNRLRRAASLSMVCKRGDDRVESSDGSLIAMRARITSRNGRNRETMILKDAKWKLKFRELLVCYFVKRVHQGNRGVTSILYNNIFLPVRDAILRETSIANMSIMSQCILVANQILRDLYRGKDILILSAYGGEQKPVDQGDWDVLKNWFGNAQFPLYFKAIIRGVMFRSFGNKWEVLTEGHLNKYWSDPLSYSSWACVSGIKTDMSRRSFINHDAYGQFQFFFRIDDDCKELASDLAGCAMGGFLDWSSPNNMFRCKVIEDDELKGDDVQSDIPIAKEDLLTDFVTHIKVDNTTSPYITPLERIVFLEHVYPSPVCIIPFWMKDMHFPPRKSDDDAAYDASSDPLRNMADSYYFWKALPYLASGAKLEHLGTDAKMAHLYANTHMAKLKLDRSKISFLTMLDLTPQNDIQLQKSPPHFQRNKDWDDDAA
jgi:hypothetical protein